MQTTHRNPLSGLVEGLLGRRAAHELARSLELPSALLQPTGADDGRLSRAQLALVLAMALFDDVCRRVPMARAYVGDAVRGGRKLVFDHGALRTVAAPSGELPAGRDAIARVLEPLGYRQVGVYPLERLGMTGFVYAHAEHPEDLPQYFVSELHPERFSPAFQEATARIVGTSRDPLSEDAVLLLAELERRGGLSTGEAARLLPALLTCFQRQHDEPRLEDWELVARESAEMAWIATEGNAFNHATDRVLDVVAVAEDQRRRGRPIKDTVEVSRSGRVRQTAFRAAEVERLFVDADGHLVARRVPGSFHEFISRDRDENGSLDLSFDAGNAQAIFKMTDAALVG